MRRTLIALTIAVLLGIVALTAAPPAARAGITPRVYLSLNEPMQVYTLSLLIQTMRSTTMAMALHHDVPDVQPTCLNTTPLYFIHSSFNLWLETIPRGHDMPISVAFQFYLRATCTGSEWTAMGDLRLPLSSSPSAPKVK